MIAAYIFPVGVFILFPVVNCEVFTAISNVENLLHTHENVLRNLEHYIEVEENRLNVLKRYLKEFQYEQDKANKDAKYVENPINAFTLIKRLSTDFEQLKTVATDVTEFVWDRDLLYPTEEDLVRAAVDIARLQYYYKLNASQLAEGNVKGVFGSPMAASDCHNLTLMLYKQEGPYSYNSYAAQWLTDESPICVPKMIAYIENDTEEVDSTQNQYQHVPCRGEVNISSSNANKLHCMYLKRSPFFMLAPIKMEVLLVNPYILLFHDVLADREIAILKEIARTKMSDVTQDRATVFPKFQLAVRPKEETAPYSMNLHLSGEEDKGMLHAACPVRHGFANMRIHEAGQEPLEFCPLVVD